MPVPTSITARYVCIERRANATQVVINVAELIIFAVIDGVEVPVPYSSGTMSSVNGNNPASFGIQNLYDNKLFTYAHTDVVFANPDYICADIGISLPISRVVVYNRVDCCQDRLNQCDLRFKDGNLSPIWSKPFPTPWQQIYSFQGFQPMTVTFTVDNVVGDSTTKIQTSVTALRPLDPTKKYFMYGPAIGVGSNFVPVQDAAFLPSGEIVYYIYDDIYTKMVTSTGTNKFMKMPLSNFNVVNWNTYLVGTGAYKLRICPSTCATTCSATGVCT
jgi:hypothetical protein